MIKLKFSKLIIEKNIPITAKGKRPKGPLNTLLFKMEVGDSVAFKKSDGFDPNRVCGHIGGFGKRNDRKFISRTTDEGIRIWRIK